MQLIYYAFIILFLQKIKFIYDSDHETNIANLLRAFGIYENYNTHMYPSII